MNIYYLRISTLTSCICSTIGGIHRNLLKSLLQSEDTHKGSSADSSGEDESDDSPGM